MKLLPKREVDAAKQKDRDRDVQQGLVLARSVDRLRETRADEEASLEAFRVKTLEAIHEETSTEQGKLETLKVEVKEYEERKAIALEPLTEKEAELARVKTEQDERGTKQDEREKEQDQREGKLDVLSQAVHRHHTAAEANRASAERLAIEAKSDRDRAAEELATAERTRKDADEYASESTLELTNREQALTHREEYAERWEGRNREEEARLVLEWVKVEDRKSMWERLINKEKNDHGT